MKDKNLCLDCKLAVWIRCKADLGRLPRGKRKELIEQLAKVETLNIRELFPFIWCPKWKTEVLFPIENYTLGCKFFKDEIGEKEASV